MFDTVRNALQNADTLAIAILILSGMVLLLLILLFAVALSLRKANRRLHGLTRGMDGDLEAVLSAHFDLVELTVRRVENVEQAVGVLQAQIPGCLSRVHVGRYDAFDDVGGEQSFTISLLNAKGDGVVLTSVYSRNDVRVYAKSIADGRSSHALSQEEEQVLRASLQG